MINAYPHATDLPSAWDALAGTVFRTRAFLEHCERHNPCHQRYYGLERDGELVAGCIAYDLTLDLFTYAKVRSPLRMSVLGVPCSVAWPGLLGRPMHTNPLLASVLEREQGLVLGLNTTPRPTINGLVQGATLPTLVLEHDFETMDAYVGALRSSYRRRYRRVRGAMGGTTRIVGSCSELSEHAYRLYLGAYERSDAKLELLSHEFFTQLPAPFQLTRFELNGALLGWHISAVEAGRTTFFMGGVDQDLNASYPSYFALLFDVIEQGIEAGTHTIDLGQTAEEPKLRTGAVPQPRGMFAWSRWGLVRGAFQRAAPLLEYSESFEPRRVFQT